MRLTPSIVAQLAARWAARRYRRRSRPHGLILMYHSVAAPAVDPWNIAVSPQNFAGHMQELSALADVVPLPDIPRMLRSGRRSRPVAAITFDDAYLDNLTAAKPCLDACDLPATVFVPTGWIGDRRPMWWDRLANVLLGTDQLPAVCDLKTEAGDFSWSEQALAFPGRGGRKARVHLHRRIWSAIRTLANDDARHAVVDSLAAVLGTDESPVANSRAMTETELRELTAGGRVQIGSHSVTHPSLPKLSTEEKAIEIERSAERCRELLGVRPPAFAYPFGDLDAESVALVRASGYTVACSIREDLIWDGEDPLLLPRIAVGNWSPSEFRKRLCWYWLA